MATLRKDGVALYLTIQNDIRDDISNGSLKANDRVMSEAEIVKKYNVSRITASKALNELAESGWIYRIQGNGTFVSENIEELLETPELNDSYNISKRTVERSYRETDLKMQQTLGLVMPDVTDDFAIKMVHSLNVSASSNGYDLITMFTGSDPSCEEIAIQRLRRSGVAGIMIYPIDYPIYNEKILEMKIDHFPFVLLDRTLPGVITSHVVSDNKTGAMRATEYLVEQGHKDILFFSDGNMHVSSVSDRLKGYKEVINKHGLENHVLVADDVFVGNRFTYSNVNNENLTKIIKNKEVSAILIAESYCCEYMTETIQQMGFSIPDDFSLITFDNPAPSWKNMEFFTYVNQNSEAMGKEAVDMLITSLNSTGENDDFYQKKIAPELCIRKSVKKIK